MNSGVRIEERAYGSKEVWQYTMTTQWRSHDPMLNHGLPFVDENSKIQWRSHDPILSLLTSVRGRKPENSVHRRFKAFFTTKPTKNGTGLGLSLSYDIVKEHEGELKAETNEGEGSMFSILLPIN